MRIFQVVLIGLGIIISIGIGSYVNQKFVSETPEPIVETPIPVSTNQVATASNLFPKISMDDVPDNKMKEDIIYGFNLFNETHIYAEEKVGANLSCTSCHAGAGLDENVASLVGVMADYPKYIARSGDIVTIEERINGCMVRSMNGEKFEVNSDELEAMVAYFKYISEGVTIGQERPWAKSADMKKVPTPSVTDGEKLYQQSCVACHAVDGTGNGANTGPALWGPESFNDGAGLGRMSKMAGYIQAYMPIGAAGSLSDQDAADLAAYILSQDRPEWTGHDKDWPQGGKPSDIMTKERRDQVKDGTINWEEVLADFK
ncbi:MULTISPECIES: c-type cytochrome [Metasolibacillus]|uniref:c-type cytochrome n=1 Tax=Metasolibacillus TaxID=2703677 RepID=UPI000D3DAE99|nr:c-type cytochrome [Metasolibacillus fluoroglycofenilyticus]